MSHSQSRAQYGNEAILEVFINHYFSLNEKFANHRESESTLNICLLQCVTVIPRVQPVPCVTS